MVTLIARDSEAVQDWPAIASWLQARGLDLALDSVRQFASGIANLNYLVTVNGQRAVLRMPPAGPVAPGAYDIERQYKVLSRLAGTFRYTPKALAYCPDTAVIGVPFLLMEFCDGLAISRTLPAEIANVPNIGAHLSELLVTSLAELHAISPSEVGLADLGRPDGFWERQVRGWHKRASLVLAGEEMRQAQAIIDWLAAHMPAARPASILHQDYKLDNVLINPVTLSIAGVIDWEMATLGDPLFDVALMLFASGEAGDEGIYRDFRAGPAEAPGWWSRRQTLDAYLAHTRTTLTEQDLKFYWLFALLRNSIASAQLVALYRRQAMPNASDRNLVELCAQGLARATYLTHEPLDW